MSQLPSTRRAFLQSSVAVGGGLMLGLHFSSFVRAAPHAAAIEINAFVRIDTMGAITLFIPSTEFGQGIYTSSAMLVCEELEVGLDQITVEATPPDNSKYASPALLEQATGGSTSTRGDWMRLREAGAVARIMLVNAAAKQWHVDPGTCRVERGVIFHDVTGRRLRYGDIAAQAATAAVPKDVTLKDPAEFKLIGTSAKRLDTPSKIDGSAIYGIDVKLPGMKIGTVAISPVKGGKIKSMDEAAARRIPGVCDVIIIDNEVASVIGDHMWAAKQGLEALNITWDAGSNGRVSTASIMAAMEQASQGSGVTARKEGDAQKAIDSAPIKLSAVYQSPFLAHAPMEPLNCTLHIRKDRAEIWVGTQVPVRAQKAVADATGLPIEKVVLTNMLMGGAFGRRLETDSVTIAAEIAKRVNYPVKVLWTREQDIQHDYYRPAYYDRVAAGLDNDGKILGRTHRVTGPSIYARWAPAFFKDGLDIDAIDGAAETPYSEAAVLAEFVRHEPQGMNTTWWRGVGPTHNGFVRESFIDEMAHSVKADPVEFRRGMLGNNQRALSVLNLAAEKAGWGYKLARGVGRGVSLQVAFGSYVSSVVEVEVSAAGVLVLKRVTAAIDCGSTVNPDTVRAQLEGGLIFGLSAAMYNEITFTAGAVDQSNFHDYRTLRMNEIPRIEIHHIRNNELPGGVGEAGTAIIAPALGNAIFAATSRRIRRLPFTGQLAGS